MKYKREKVRTNYDDIYSKIKKSAEVDCWRLLDGLKAEMSVSLFSSA